MKKELSAETKRVLKMTIKKLQTIITRTGKPGTGTRAKENMVRTIASTNCKEAWEFLVCCYADSDYDICNDVIGEMLSGYLSRFHAHEEEPDKPCKAKA